MKGTGIADGRLPLLSVPLPILIPILPADPSVSNVREQGSQQYYQGK